MNVQWPTTMTTSTGAVISTGASASANPTGTGTTGQTGSAAVSAAGSTGNVSGTAQQGKALSEKDLQKVVGDLEKRVQSAASELRFSVDAKTDHFVVKVVDGSTQEVIRQFPSEEALKLGQEIDRMRGLLFNEKA